MSTEASTTDSGFRVGDPCEAIVAEFAFGPETCGKPSSQVAIDPTWGTSHVACSEHAGSSQTSDGDA